MMADTLTDGIIKSSGAIVGRAAHYPTVNADAAE